MSVDLRLCCACGATRGIVRGLTPSDVNRVVCYCSDCRAFARHLGRTDLIDEHGGTSILQMSVARFELTDGTEHLRCIHLSPAGLHRWVAGCCQTPIGNTQGSVPVLGLIDGFVERGDTTHPYDAFGPRVGVHGAGAIGDRSTLDAHPSVPFGMVLSVGFRLLGWWVRGDARRSPFLAPGGGLRVVPTVLTPDERAAARDPA